MCIEETTPNPPFSASPLPTMVWLKTPATPEKGDDTAPGSDVQAEAVEERLILCRECLFPITREEDQSAMEGGQQHTFANPAGIVFTIGCFSAAEGCAPVGPSSDEFTWFPGFTWRVGICRGCLAHLGWYFSAPSGTAFWGLILDHLIFPS
ncbi:MAG: hypothetical protein KQI78_20750 [Deltaproteobacteria bacterium]|jgi:hypothetical protein|nr:hypothetical protein [Deltaproteobacteria bacterium]